MSGHIYQHINHMVEEKNSRPFPSLKKSLILSPTESCGVLKMRILGLFAAGAVLALSACVTPDGTAVNVDPNLQKRATLPADVAAKVAAGQDTSDIRVDARDGCLMYHHKGPVETTYIPLRNKQGRPICVKTEAAA